MSDLPGPQRAAVAQLATAIRASVTELHEILGLLGGERRPARGMSAAGSLIEEFSAAGAAVSVRSRGRPRSLAPQAEEAAYRVIEEGLTNAIRHAPGQPVSVTVGWEAGTLLLTVANAADCRAYAPGSGLAGLDRRLRQAGGLLGHELSDGLFRLHAVLPATLPSGARQRSGVNALALATGILLLVLLPVTLLLGVR